jgi:hypothetical protein
MFWSHQDNSIEAPVESIGWYLKEELRLRLRVAADFATLGAYELLEDDEGPVSGAVTETPDERVVLDAPPKRVLLFAKVAPVCPHSGPAAPACTNKRPPRPRTRHGRTLRQRGGSVRAPTQPCVFAGEPVPGA